MFNPIFHIRQIIEQVWNIIQSSYNVLSDPIILVLLSVFIATIVAFLLSKREEKQKGKKAFRLLWQSSKKLKYIDLSGRKEIKEKYPSTQAHLQGEVEKLLKAGKNILITSNSGAGKTHFTTNYLKHLDKAYVLIPNADDFDKNYAFIPIPPKKARYKIILLDDFHTFFSTGVLRLPSLIEHAIGDGYTIWANTISGDEFEIVRSSMPPKLLSQFNELSIKANLGRDEAKGIAKAEGIEKLPDSFAGNIGDIFQDLVVQKARYESLDAISRMLLITIKRLYMVGIYRPPFNMLKADVRNLLKFYESEISGETIISKYDDLRQKEFILKSNDPLTINFEEKYLRTIVAPQLKVKDFLTNICQIFPNNVATFTQAMQAANNYEDSVKIYHSMLEKNIHPNKRPFSVLIGKADDSDIGLTWLNEMDKFELEPDEYILNVLLRTTKNDTEKRQRVVNEMQKRGLPVKQHIANMFEARKIQSNITEYYTLMNLSGSYEKALTLFQEMNEVGIKPDAKSYTILIKLSSDFEIGMRLFKEMKNEGVAPRASTYGTLINLSNDFDKGMELLNQMKEEGVKPDASVYGTLINLSKDVDKGMELLNQMKEEGVKPDASVYGTLINLSKDVDKGMELLKQMKEEGVKSDSLVYGTLINLSDDFDKGKEFFNQMIEDGFKPNVEIYGTLINRSNDFDKGIELLNQMKKEDVKPTVITYGTLINLSKDFNKGKKLIDQMIEEGLRPNVEIYGTLINLSDDFDKGKELFDKAIKEGLKPNVEIYNTLINCSKDFDKGMELLKQMKNEGVAPRASTYGTLVNLSKDFDKGMELLKQMKNEGVKADNAVYGTLINLSKDFNKGKKLIDQMIKDGIMPDLWTYATLFYLSKDYNNWKPILDQMIKDGLKPDVRIYTKLIQLSSNDPQNGWKLLDEMISLGVKPNVRTFNTLIWLYKNDYQVARAILVPC